MSDPGTWRTRSRRFQRWFFDFWSAPTTGASASLFRIAFGVLSIWTAIGVLLNLERYFGGNGGLPWKAIERSVNAPWSFFFLAPYDGRLLWGVGIAFLVASVTFTLGVFSRTSAIVIWAVNVSLQNRNAYIQNGGDRLFLILALLAAFLPLARKWSLSAWWRARRGRPPVGEPTWWSLRLIQVQIAYLYASTGLVKVGHVRWLGGRAMRDVLASPVYNEWPTYLDFWPLVYFLSWSTLLFEIGFAVLAFVPKTRRPILLWGVLFHVGIDVFMVIPMFSVIMIVSYAAFLTDDESERIVAWCLRPFGRLMRFGRAPAPSVPVPETEPSEPAVESGRAR